MSSRLRWVAVAVGSVLFSGCYMAIGRPPPTNHSLSRPERNTVEDIIRSNTYPLAVVVETPQGFPASNVIVYAKDEGHRFYGPQTSGPNGVVSFQTFGLPTNAWEWRVQFAGEWQMVQPLQAVFPSDSGQGLRGVLRLIPIQAVDAAATSVPVPVGPEEDLGGVE